MNWLRKITVAFDYILGICAILAGVFIIFVLLSVCTEVFMRYFLGRPQVWVLELTEYSLLLITFLGTAWVLRGEGHVKIELVLSRLKPKAQASINIITSIISALVLLVIAWYALKATWNYYQTGFFELSMLDVPKAPIMAVIPIGSTLLLIQFLRRAYGYLGNLKTPQYRDQGR